MRPFHCTSVLLTIFNIIHCCRELPCLTEHPFLVSFLLKPSEHDVEVHDNGHVGNTHLEAYGDRHAIKFLLYISIKTCHIVITIYYNIPIISGRIIIFSISEYRLSSWEHLLKKVAEVKYSSKKKELLKPLMLP